MGGLFSTKTAATQSTQATGLTFQTSSYGKAVSLIYGTTRVAPNLIFYGGFQAVPQPQKSGGKGGSSGGGKGGGASSYNYFVDVMFAIGQGPITSCTLMWVSQTFATVASQGISIFNGSFGQPIWSLLSSKYPSQAIPYSGTAFAAAASLALGTSASLPNFNFLVSGQFSGTAPNGVDADPSLVVRDLLTNAFYGAGFPALSLGTIRLATETFTVPGSAPFTITVAHAANYTRNLSVSLGISPTAMTCVASNPAPNQYSFSQAGVYTFNAATIGSQVTVTYTWLDDLTDYKNFVLASGLGISPAYTQQTKVSTMLDEIATLTYADFVWSSGVLTLVPRGTMAISANGHSYTPPNTPLFDLTDDDFMDNVGGTGGTSTDPVILSRTRTSDQDNVIQLEFYDKDNQFATSIAEVTDQALVDRFGRRFSGSKTAHIFTDVNSANTSAQLQMQREYVRNSYSFTLDQRYCVLDPMDLVTVTDPALGLNHQLVRITDITENDDGSVSVVAEEYPLGTGAAALYNFNQGQGYNPNFNADPGLVNPPFIYEVPVELATNTGLEIWCGISANGQFWGGAEVWVSSDGNTYSSVGKQFGSSRMGVTTTNFPVGNDPDLINAVSVNLSQSGGQLASGTQTDADLGHLLCLIDQELISYETANLIGTNQYQLESYIRRGMYGSSVASHATGAPFVRLDDQLFVINYRPDQIGKTIFIKLTSFNMWEGGEETLATAKPFMHRIIGPPPPGQVQNFNVTQAPGFPPVFSWTDLDDFALKGYDISYGPVGSTVDAATLLTEATRATEMTNASVPPGNWVFYIRGRDIADQLGAPATCTFTVTNVSGAVLTNLSGPDWVFGGQTGTASAITILTEDSPTPFQIPTLVNNLTTIQCIGPGGKGALGLHGLVGPGGGGGAVAIVSSIDVPPGGQVSFQIAPGKPTWFRDITTALADFGRDATSSTAGAGGLVANSVGTIIAAGGAGAAAPGGGGGAAGPSGKGGDAVSAQGGTGDNLKGGAPGIGVNANLLLNCTNDFDNVTYWTISGTGATVGTGDGPVQFTVTSPNLGKLQAIQFLPASHTQYTISAYVASNSKFRFGFNSGSADTFSSDMSGTGGRVSWTVTTGTVTAGGYFFMSGNGVNGSGVYWISHFKVELGATATFLATPGQDGMEFLNLGGCGGGGTAALIGSAGGNFGAGGGGSGQPGAVYYDPTQFNGNLFVASGNLPDPAWQGFPSATPPTVVANGTNFTVTFAGTTQQGLRQFVSGLKPNTTYNVSGLVYLAGTTVGASANGTTITFPTNGSIVDLSNNVWSIASDATILINGVVAGRTQNVTLVLLWQGVIYQEAFGLWWDATVTGTGVNATVTWIGVSGDPRTTPPGTSGSGTNLSFPTTGQIVDSGSNIWTIASNDTIIVNGVPANVTNNVAILLWFGGTIYQKNSAGTWYSAALTGAGITIQVAWTQIAGDPRGVGGGPGSRNYMIGYNSNTSAGNFNQATNWYGRPLNGSAGYVAQTSDSTTYNSVDGTYGQYSSDHLFMDIGVSLCWSDPGGFWNDMNRAANNDPSYVNAWKQNAQSMVGYKILAIRPGWEMNGNWYPWSLNSSGINTTYANFAAAYRNCVNAFRSVLGNQLMSCYCTSGNFDHSGHPWLAPPNGYFPGWDIIDIAASDFYLGGNCNSWADAQSSSPTNNWNIDQIVAAAQANGKLFAIPETSTSTESTQWYNDMFDYMDSIGNTAAYVVFFPDWGVSLNNDGPEQNVIKSRFGGTHFGGNWSPQTPDNNSI